jgi:hypothetical protein
MSKKKKNNKVALPSNYDLAKSRANKLRQALTDNGIRCEDLWHYETEDGKITEIRFTVDLYDIERNPISFGFNTNTGKICQDV